MMKVVDSSAWIEYFADAPLAAAFEPHLHDPDCVVTPTVVLYEVYRWARRECTDEEAMLMVGQLEQTTLTSLDGALAVVAAELSADHGLAAADAVVYATARISGYELVTADADFRGLKDVVLIEPGSPEA
jgi:predicted nucleic acid-binding protein